MGHHSLFEQTLLNVYNSMLYWFSSKGFSSSFYTQLVKFCVELSSWSLSLYFLARWTHLFLWLWKLSLCWQLISIALTFFFWYLDFYNWRTIWFSHLHISWASQLTYNPLELLTFPQNLFFLSSLISLNATNTES